jgi:hypothetical protein
MPIELQSLSVRGRATSDPANLHDDGCFIFEVSLHDVSYEIIIIITWLESRMPLAPRISHPKICLAICDSCMPSQKWHTRLSATVKKWSSLALSIQTVAMVQRSFQLPNSTGLAFTTLIGIKNYYEPWSFVLDMKWPLDLQCLIFGPLTSKKISQNHNHWGLGCYKTKTKAQNHGFRDKCFP